MQIQVFRLVTCILLGIVLYPSQADDFEECPPYETDVECIDFCNTCESDGRQCIFPCTSGCDCISGYTRDRSGNCIPRRFCDGTDSSVNTPPTCPDVEKCRQYCNQRGFKAGICYGPGKTHCWCIGKEQMGSRRAYWNCNDSSCPDYCKRLGYKNAVCDSARDSCSCDNW